MYVPAHFRESDTPTLAVLQRLTATHEARIGGSYAVPDDDHAIAQLSRGVVAFEVAITEMTGKLKMSQNRTASDRASVRAHLGGSGDPLERDVAVIMGEREERV